MCIRDRGKTTTSISLSMALNKIGKKSVVALREPSLGPVFGIKGGATGGGLSQVLPTDDINLLFTGDIPAIERANNLLSALIDNNLQSKNRNLNLDSRTIHWNRAVSYTHLDVYKRQVHIRMSIYSKS